MSDESVSDKESWTIEVAERRFVVPRLPLRATRIVYPICQRLSNDGLAERLLKPDTPLQVTESEMDDLARIAFLACQSVETEMTQADFDALPMTPPQLFDAFFAIRHACGGWRVLPAAATAEGQEPAGEASGA